MIPLIYHQKAQRSRSFVKPFRLLSQRPRRGLTTSRIKIQLHSCNYVGGIEEQMLELNRGRFDKELPGPSRGRFDKELPGPSRGRFDKELPGPSRVRFDQELPGPSRGRFDKELPGPSRPTIIKPISKKVVKAKIMLPRTQIVNNPSPKMAPTTLQEIRRK